MRMSKNLTPLPTYKKVIVLLIIIGLLMLFSIFIVVYQTQTKSLLEASQAYTNNIAMVVNEFLDKEKVEKIINNESNANELEQEIVEYFSKLNLINSKMRALIINEKKTMNDEIEFVIYQQHKADTNFIENGKFKLVPSQEFNNAFEKVISTGEAQITKPTGGPLGNNIYSIFPMKNSNNEIFAFFSLSYNYDGVVKQQKQMFLYLTVVFIFILIGISYGLTIFLRREFVPLANIFKGITEISKGNFNYKIESEYPSEYNGLIFRLNDMTSKLKILFDQLEDTIKQLNITECTITIDQLDNAINGVSQIKDTMQIQYDIQQTEKMNAIGQLAASVAHEIRNPLTVVKGFIQIFDRKSNLTKDEKSFILLMKTEIERAETIINDYLSLAKPEVIHSSVVNVNEQIIKVQSLLTSYAVMNNNIAIVLDLRSNVSIIGNGNELIQLLVNIVKNSIEAMKDGGIVQLKLEETEEFAVITITDNGIGMTEEVISKLGTPFYSLKEKGTGIGMMVCYQIVKKLNGTIEITSALNIGTTFVIKIPKV